MRTSDGHPINRPSLPGALLVERRGAAGWSLHQVANVTCWAVSLVGWLESQPLVSYEATMRILESLGRVEPVARDAAMPSDRIREEPACVASAAAALAAESGALARFFLVRVYWSCPGHARLAHALSEVTPADLLPLLESTDAPAREMGALMVSLLPGRA